MTTVVKLEGTFMPTSATRLRSLERMFDQLRTYEADFPASYASVLIYVAKCEDQGQSPPSNTDIAENTGIHFKAISRIVMSMSDRRRGNTPLSEERPSGARKALGLLERKYDDVDLRLRRVGLTARGRRLVNQLAELAAG